MTPNDPLERIRIVLVQPSHPGNIGAAARAMKTMGLTRLYLVAPRTFPHAEADARATGAADVLHAARVCDSLDQALAGVRFSCALSARPRDLAPVEIDMAEAAREAVAEAAECDAAIVFGPERVGLEVGDVSRCTRLVRIPANPAFSSLNLAAAVQIACYEVRRAVPGARIAASAPMPALAPHEDVERLVRHFEDVMRATGFLHPDRPGRLVQRLRRLFGRARLEPAEAAILRGFLHACTQPRPPSPATSAAPGAGSDCPPAEGDP